MDPKAQAIVEAFGERILKTVDTPAGKVIMERRICGGTRHPYIMVCRVDDWNETERVFQVDRQDEADTYFGQLESGAHGVSEGGSTESGHGDDRVRQEGRDAYRSGESTPCPYPAASRAASVWREGYHQRSMDDCATVRREYDDWREQHGTV